MFIRKNALLLFALFISIISVLERRGELDFIKNIFNEQESTQYASPLASKKSAGTYQGFVVEVIDGDSLVVQKKASGKLKTIRLYGIDAPEGRQSYGSQATYFTRQFLLNKNVTVDVKDTDRYKRQVAVVDVDGETIQEALLKNGNAWYYGRHCKDKSICPEWKEAESMAREKRIGLWRANNPQNPADWRKENR